MVFDGGYVQKPIISEAMRYQEYEPNAITSFAKTVRDMRNALSHGRDQKTMLFIHPTTHNFDRLQPWAVTHSRGSLGSHAL
jgi:hypothetical protein